MANMPTVRYSDADLDEFKILIDSKLEKARNELAFLREQIIELNENSTNQRGGDWFDDSSTHSELEMLNNQVSRQQTFIRDLENALIRIKNKTYGICTVTGNLIDKKRLMLVPHATKSVEGKHAEAEQKKIQAAAAEAEAKANAPKITPVEKAPTPKVISKVVKKNSPKKGKNAAPPAEDDFEDDLLLDSPIGDDDAADDAEDNMYVDMDQISDKDSGDDFDF